jgi:hypothetical protein
MKAIEIQNQFGIIFLTFNGKWDMLYFTDEETIMAAIAQMRSMCGSAPVAKFIAENHKQFGDSEEIDVADPFQYIKQYPISFRKYVNHEYFGRGFIIEKKNCVESSSVWLYVHFSDDCIWVDEKNVSYEN